MAGTFKTRSKTSLDFSLPELNPTAVINTTVHITEDMSNYDMIIGRDLLHKLGLILNFKDRTVQWDNSIVEMKLPNSNRSNSFSIEEPKIVSEETERIKNFFGS